MWRAALLAAGLLSVASCAVSPVQDAPNGADPVALLSTCCDAVEKYPGFLVTLVEPKADRKPAIRTPHRLRPAYLSDKPEAVAYLMARLRPLDLLVTADKGLLTGRLVPGYFSHSLVYLGTEAQLRAAGLWHLPALRAHHAAIREGHVFYESRPPRVDFADPAKVLDVDSAAILRPDLAPGQAEDALRALLARHRVPFDSHLDSGTPDCLYCAELLDVAMPFLELPRQSGYGRETVVPDAIAAHAIRPDTPLRFIAFLHATPGGAISAPATTLAATIRRYWPG
ncbi:hypothetical protein AVJ23_19590 [Pseudoponticoccus marisrubri]|uniref:Lipoprotein n=2 Tax=Pseudoponticoccus marisrubri TaxID=1685382 RepID=A0A0W7WEG6_9RHOB|nr:hypothetical protein AVJ23_19590 [Pseudoponticoccus marisrubri]